MTLQGTDLMPAGRPRKPSTIFTVGDFAVVRLNGRYADEGYALIDAADVPLVEGVSWTVIRVIRDPCKYDYVTGRVNGKRRFLHRYIMNAQPGEYVDHRDHNGLNCRRDNMRLCSVGQNMMNSRKMTTLTADSQHKGVSRSHGCRSWTARIFANGRHIHLGSFRSALEAAAAYDLAAQKYFGCYAFTNFGSNHRDMAE
jgi:hypothetical protein